MTFWGAVFALFSVVFASGSITYLLRATIDGHPGWAQTKLSLDLLFASFVWGLPVVAGSLVLAALLARLFTFRDKAFLRGLVFALVVGVIAGFLYSLPTQAPAPP